MVKPPRFGDALIEKRDRFASDLHYEGAARLAAGYRAARSHSPSASALSLDCDAGACISLTTQPPNRGGPGISRPQRTPDRKPNRLRVPATWPILRPSRRNVLIKIAMSRCGLTKLMPVLFSPPGCATRLTRRAPSFRLPLRQHSPTTWTSLRPPLATSNGLSLNEINTTARTSLGTCDPTNRPL